ncbi:FecCD family ABC transporter permease [Sutcliffiella halmapala]|uniref:FecCD family ABC transporter permease n=1 Tax=Sutcliffiella halmapala TaxID=79882 RepID=UPI000995BF79|nr:iron ABC transporter permease [Sutcliffiella halmapala]
MKKQQRLSGNLIKLIMIFSVFSFVLIIISAVTVTFRVDGLTWKNMFQLNDSVLSYTVWSIRMPRLLLAVILGASLATAGCLLQAMTRNSLSDPEIIGINQGASCFAVIAIMLFEGRGNSTVIMIGALIGASVVAVLIFLISRYSGKDFSRLLLAGVAISAFMGAFTTSIILLYETQLSEVLYWMAGKLSGAEWLDNQLAWAVNIPAILFAFLLANSVNTLVQGEEIALGLGVKVVRTQQLLGLLIIIMTGSAVAVAGPIGFIGLMVPHMSKRIVGANHRIVLPLAALMGANLLAAADFAAQWAFYPTEIPVGIVTAFLGVPFFIYLLRRSGGKIR